MPRTALTGSRIRQRRLDLGVKQAELARQIGISASYLNLIEHNRRRIGGKLLIALAGVLQIEPIALSQGGEAAMLEGLQQVAAQAGAKVEVAQIEELAGRFPGWAARIAEQDAKITALEQIVGGLNDRLTHDPVLSEKMHEVLSTVSAIRSTSSILVETPDIDAEWRNRFHTNIDTESRRLAETSAAMAAHFDRLSSEGAGFSTPLEVVAEFFEARRFHIDAIEQGGARAIPSIIRGEAAFANPETRKLADVVLHRYAEDAARLPLAQFRDAAARADYDPGALAQEFNTDPATIFRRLASLPASAEMPEIGLVSCDAAGAILLRKSPPGFSLPRYGAACPLWPLFAALSAPGHPVRLTIESAEAVCFDAFAIATPAGAARFDQPNTNQATMLLIRRDDTANTSRPVGASCRVCPRQGCIARREPSILRLPSPS